MKIEYSFEGKMMSYYSLVFLDECNLLGNQIYEFEDRIMFWENQVGGIEEGWQQKVILGSMYRMRREEG